jgi:hypothetical protein
MSNLAPGLGRIGRGIATPLEARDALLAALVPMTREGAEDAYLALRAWTWKALDGRRRDPELRGWSDIITAAAALMGQRGHADLAERLRALDELVLESAAVGDAISVEGPGLERARAFWGAE